MPMDDTTGKEKPLEIQGAYGWSKGHSLYDFYIREYAGVDPETGMALYNSYYNVSRWKQGLDYRYGNLPAKQ